MLALKIIGVILLLFILFLLVRVGLQADYSSEGFSLYLKVGVLRYQLQPRRAKPEKETAKRRKKERKRNKSKVKQPKKEKTEPEKGDLKWLLELISPALTALSRLRRKLRVERIKIDYSIGGSEDPAAAAIKYGKVAAGGGSLFPLVNAALDVRDWDLNLGVDFNSDRSQVAFSAAGTYRIGQLLYTSLSLGFNALSTYMKHQKQITQEEELKYGRKASDR